MASKNIKGITIEIGADTTGLDKALGGVEKESKKTKSELSEVNKALKDAPESVKLWEQKQKLLTQAVEDSQKKVKLLEDAQEQVNEQFKAGTIGEEQYRAFERELEKARSEVAKYEQGASDAADKIKDLGSKTEDTKGEVKDLGDNAEKSSGGFTVLKGAVAELAADGFEKLMGAAKDAWAEIDEGYDTIITKTGASGAALQDMQDIADEVFTDLPVEMTDVGTAIGEVNTRFGATGEQLKDLSEIFLQYAEINGTSVNGSIDNVSAALRAFGVDASQTSDVLGVLTDISQKTGISTSSLESTLLANSATFKEMGLSIGESAQLLGQMEINGVDTSTALAALKKAQQNATAEGRTLSESLSETVESIKSSKDETKALQTATELFGKKGAAAMTQAIREGRLDINEYSDSIEGMGKKVTDTFEATQDAPDEMKKTLNSLKLELSDLANKVLPYAQTFIEKFNQKLPDLKSKVEKFEPLIEGIGGVVKNTIGIIGDAADWIGTVVERTIGHQDYIDGIYEKQIEHTHDLTEEIKDQKDQMKELTDKSNDQIEADIIQANKTKELWEELKHITDESGKIKAGYEDRAGFITNELTEATGIEIELVDGQIQKYKELQLEIEKTIQKQRANIFKAALSDKYSEAIMQQSTYGSQRYELEGEISKAQSTISGLKNKARNAGANIAGLPELTSMNQDYWSMYLNDADFAKIRAAEDSIIEAKKSLSELSKNADYNAKVIEMYEKADAEYQAENYALAESTFAQINSLSLDSLHELEGNFTETTTNVQKKLDEALQIYKYSVEKNVKGADDTLRSTVNDTIQYGLDNGLTGADMLKTGIVNKLSEIDTFDIEALKNFMAETGITLGQILSTVSMSEMSSSMRSAVTELIYETNDLILSSINSPGDVQAYHEGRYKLGRHASGGYISEGSAGIIAEAGPELVELSNGSVKVTPLSRGARNTAIGNAGSVSNVYYDNITVNAKISNDYDVDRLGEKLAEAKKRREIGKGLIST